MLNYTLKNKVVYAHPKYNLNPNMFFVGYYSKEIAEATAKPVIIHYACKIKPWQMYCKHPFWGEYFKYLKLSPFKDVLKDNLVII